MIVIRRFLIATHGKLADGVADSVRMLAGDRNDIDYFSAYADRGDPAEFFTDYFAEHSGDEIIAFTDLLSGSVNKELLYYAGDRVKIITGFNLAVILELILMENEAITDNVIEDAIVSGRCQLTFVNKMIKEGNGND